MGSDEGQALGPLVGDPLLKAEFVEEETQMFISSRRQAESITTTECASALTYDGVKSEVVCGIIASLRSESTHVSSFNALIKIYSSYGGSGQA